jgi:hypothetical protein
MGTIRGPARAFCTIGSALLILTGCDKLTSDGTDWARAALERNEQLTIVAFDKSAKTFTVKMKDTGELRVVRADQIVGTFPATAQEQATSKPAAATVPAAANAESTAAASAAPAAAGEVQRPAAEVEARYPLAGAAKSAEASGTSANGTAVITDAATGNVLASNASTGDEAQAEAKADAKADARSDRKVLASGPGYSIKAGDTPPPAPIRLASRSSDIPSPTRGVALERRYEPMICQGQQMMHIDGRNLEFEGDAISAEDGCEIHITNSHIIAHGLGVSARAANVHIKNSVVEGDSGSVSASEGAQVYTQSSTFKGLSRRLDTASFHDLGGTVWN